MLIFFGRYVTDKVSNQKTLYSATSNNVKFYTTWQNGETRKSHTLKCCISALPEINQSLLDSFNLVDSRLILALLYDSLNLVINAFSSGLSGAWLRRKEVKAQQQLDCVARTMHVRHCAIFLKEKMSSVMCLIASNIC